MRRRLLPLVLVSLMLTSSMASVLGASGREVVDNWDDGDAWVEISLISWVANQTEEWDSSGGLPDPRFKICLAVDGEDLDCIDTPTWENQWELNATWNYTVDIPDTSNLLNITIECEDNDAFNDDECDMNADVNEWKLYAEYNWSQNPNMTISGNGDGDGNGTWKNAASVWEVKVFGFGDEDGDGVPDNIDACPNTTESFGNVNQSVFPGCSWGQLDVDGDGIPNPSDQYPFHIQFTAVVSTGDLSSWQNLEGEPLHGPWVFTKSCEPSVRMCGDKGGNFIIFENPTNGETGIRDIDNFDSNNAEFTQFFLCFDGQPDHTGTNCDYYIWDSSNSQHFPHYISELNSDGIVDVVLGSVIFFGEYIDDNFFLIQQSLMPTDDGGCKSHQSGKSFYVPIDLNFDGVMELLMIGNDEYSRVCLTGADIQPTFHSYVNGIECDQDFFQIISEKITESHIIKCGNKITRLSSSLDNYTSSNIISLISDEYLVDSQYGGLGDINRDGYVDYIQGNNSGDFSCELFLGNSGLRFENPIVLFDGESASHGPYRDACEGRIEILDLDGDEDMDFASRRCVVENDGAGFVPYCTSSPDTSDYFRFYDYDGDGDLDRITNSANSIHWFEHPGFQDEDGDGVKDGLDVCPQSNSSISIDTNGCDLKQRDSDLDGVVDFYDQCPNTPQTALVDSQGCFSGQLDSDGDGISDAMDLCPATPAGESTNLEGCSQSEVDTDADGVVNSNDACPGTAQGSIVDANGCSESDVVDNDADGDGVVDAYDACPSTIVGSTVDQNGCSDAQLDIDGDGIPNTRDQCPGTSSGAEVSYYGCSASQGDEDLDGVLNVDDDCPGSWFVDKDNPPETSNGCDGMLESQDDDEDGDGLVDSYDECPDTPAGQSVDDQGCTDAQRNTLADEASSEGDTGDAIVGMFCCFGLLWLVFSATTKSRKKSSTPHRYVQAPPQVIHQQSIHQQQQVMRELENQRQQAEHQVAQLQQQLHQSNQMSATQLASVQSQLSDMQQQVTATNMAKTDMQRELEQMKAQEVERNTLTESPVNIQDSAVAGDSLIGSTKIENQTVNDADAIARAAAAAAIDAYRMGLDDRER